MGENCHRECVRAPTLCSLWFPWLSGEREVQRTGQDFWGCPGNPVLTAGTPVYKGSREHWVLTLKTGHWATVEDDGGGWSLPQVTQVYWHLRLCHMQQSHQGHTSSSRTRERAEWGACVSPPGSILFQWMSSTSSILSPNPLPERTRPNRGRRGSQRWTSSHGLPSTGMEGVERQETPPATAGPSGQVCSARKRVWISWTFEPWKGTGLSF